MLFFSACFYSPKPQMSISVRGARIAGMLQKGQVLQIKGSLGGLVKESSYLVLRKRSTAPGV